MSFSWDRPPSDAFAELAEAYGQTIYNAVLQVCQRFTPQIEAWMKENASWTDRTGNARQTLWSDVETISKNMIIVILSHGVNYGQYLEWAHGSAYAIIAPALDHWGPRLWSEVRRLLGA